MSSVTSSIREAEAGTSSGDRNWNMQYMSSTNPAYITVKGAVGDPKPGAQTTTTTTSTSSATTTPTAPPSPRASRKIGFDKSYLFSINGLLRALVILMLIGGWIAAAASEKSSRFLDLVDDYKATRLAYIVITVVATGFSIMLFIFYLFNIINVGILARMNFPFLTLILDALFFFPLIALGITCAVREADYEKRRYVPNAINKGSFGAMAFFAFAAALIYAGLCLIAVIGTIKARRR